MDLLLHVGLSNALTATLLAIVVAAVGPWVRRPALRHGLWLLVLLKLVTPPLVPVAVSWPRPVEPTTAAPSAIAKADTAAVTAAPVAVALHADVPTEPAAPEAEPAARWQPAVLWPAAGVAWLAGSALWLVVTLGRGYHFVRLLRFARPATVDEQARVDRLVGRLGLTRGPALSFLPATVSPMLWAWAGRARLLVPDALWARLTGEQRDTLLVHELAHLRRRDHWVRRLELVVLCLYWWLPVAWWARRRLEEAEEECCDAWVVWALPAAGDAYATALVETVGFLSNSPNALPVSASGIGHVHLLRRRLTMIMHGPAPRALGWGGLLGVLALAALLLPWLPTWALTDDEQDPPPSPPDPLPAVAPPQRTPGGPGAPGRPANATPDFPAMRGRLNEALTDAQDEIELLRLQVKGKEAEVQEARALQAKAASQLKRVEQLHKNGQVDAETIDQARTELEVQTARLNGKQVQREEAMIRLRKAERGYATLKDRYSNRPVMPGGMTGGPGMGPGPGVMAGPGGMTGAGVPDGPGGAPGGLPRGGGGAGIGLGLPGGGGGGPRGMGPAMRGAAGPTLSGPRNGAAMSPDASGAGLPRAPGGMTGMRGMPGMSGPGGVSDERLQQLEQKLDSVLKEVDALRKELRPQPYRRVPPGGGAPAAP